MMQPIVHPYHYTRAIHDSDHSKIMLNFSQLAEAEASGGKDNDSLKNLNRKELLFSLTYFYALLLPVNTAFCCYCFNYDSFNS